MPHWFSSIHLFSQRKLGWGLLFLACTALEISALYFQHVMDLAPCVMCIYQRNAVFGVMLAALVGLIGCHNRIARWLALLGWGVSTLWGLKIAYEHVDIQTAANPFFATCEVVPRFPSWLPLHEWLPNVFAATGSCGDIDWQFLSLSMPQWMMVIFAGMSLAWLIVIVANLFGKPEIH
ncbi:Disulfide bond formation protein [Saliniradius amylolyticus]|uniref:Disulfide bond formation protein B n=1 Tax=Saliniradius amylolyticus TaxID=2183582 RepID=A0A2S2E168_9ALTE|nr:disulfide bond formation protein DsbB [Saliniradius amylolyticus]AWL11384.1 Disulfide bond formation protein [Saliniradius amylolyticus]